MLNNSAWRRMDGARWKGWAPALRAMMLLPRAYSVHALIIEQDIWIILMIEDVLRELGFTSFAYASSPLEAAAAANERCPDLITSDMRLDAGTGIEAVQQICADKVIPVVFVTATPWEIRQFDRAAIVVPKPFCHETLKLGVERAATMRTD